jgi:hypothetical protein
MAPHLKGQILPQLRSQVSAMDNLDRQKRAAAAILRIVPKDEGGFLRAGIMDCARNDDVDAVETLVETYRDVLGDYVREIITALLERAQQLRPGGAHVMSLLVSLAGSMSTDQRHQLRGQLRDSMTTLVSTAGALDQLRPVLDRAGTEEVFASDYELLVREIWDVVKGQPDPQLPLLEFVLEHFDRLDVDRREAVITQFGNWLTQHSHLRTRLPEFAARIPDPKAREREQLVEAIIDGERLESEPNTRTAMLKAAESLAGPRTSRASKRLKERIGALEDGSDADQAVWRQMTAEPA